MTASFDLPQATQALELVHSRIAAAALAAHRSPQGVSLLAVSKIQPTEKIRALYAAGQRAFGENYVQEGVEKVDEFLRSDEYADIQWHLIGPLQSNKTRVVAEYFHWVHSVDRLKIAERLSAQRPLRLPPLNVCVQVNISGEASKSGCAANEAITIARAVSTLPQIKLRGVMGMPEPGMGEAATRAQFMVLADVFTEIAGQIEGVDTLSMGMSDDLEWAVACGSTMVRVGTALFGARSLP